MNREELRKRISEGILVLDGAMGTELMRAGLPQGIIPEEWVLEKPEMIGAVNAGYAGAGSDAVYSCTFGANRINLTRHGLAGKVAEVNRAGVAIARKAAGAGRHVFGSVGPIGELLEPYGDIPEEDARVAFREQVEALVSAGVDALVSESNTCLPEAVLAVTAARAAGNIAIIATMTFEGADKAYRTVMGTTPEQAAEELLKAGADAVGVNCGRGGADALEVIRRMRSAHPGVILVAKPNAGLPTLVGGKLNYATGPGDFAREGLALRDAGARILGGCCGTTPAHLKALVNALKD